MKIICSMIRLTYVLDDFHLDCSMIRLTYVLDDFHLDSELDIGGKYCMKKCTFYPIIILKK